MNRKYKDMTVEELAKALERLKREMDDLEDERMMVLGQSGQHINGVSVSQRFDTMLTDLQDEAEQIRSLISKR